MPQAENRDSSESAASSIGNIGINYSRLRREFRAAEADLFAATGAAREEAFIQMVLTTSSSGRDLALKATMIGARVNEQIAGHGFTFGEVLVWDAERLVKRAVYQ